MRRLPAKARPKIRTRVTHMRISVFGLGYVGTVCAACLADRGHTVVGIDKATAKVDLIRSRRSPVLEREIDEIVERTVKSGRLTATADVNEAVRSTDLSLVCVGTPSRRNGALGLAAIEAVSTEIGQALRSKRTRHEVVVRSTVLPGTTRNVILPRLIDSSGKTPGDAFGLAFNPEFMREGSSVVDFNNPSRTIVGALEARSTDAVFALYSHLPGRKIETDIEAAEMVKYVDNTWHALKVAFTNEVSVVASTLGIDSCEVMDIFAADNRLNISRAYMRPGFAFGGSCLPKDLRALDYLARTRDLSLPVIGHILDSNRMLTNRGLDWILARSKKRVAFLGISFKSGTDDVRESPYVSLVEGLSGKGRTVRIFDPNVNLAHLFGANRDYLMRTLPHIADLLVPTIREATDWADTVVVTSPDPVYAAEVARLGEDKVVLDFAAFHCTHEEQVACESEAQLPALAL
jgi:GDP-mannose 6-dehydrogenase